LLAAARRIGKELAIIRTGEPQPAPEALRQAIRDVVQHCIYGVDLNPLAVDLCKVALWIEGFCKGLPLNFLDHRIKCGNSLVGVLDISCLDEGIPDDAFKAVTGDDKKLATLFKTRNKKERKDLETGQISLNFVDLETGRSEYIEKWREFAEIPETTPKEIKQKQSQYQQNHSENNQGWWRDFSACNLWTAAFFMGLTEQNLQLLPTTEALKQLLNGNPVTQKLVDAANKLAEDKRFFHWCLEFPDVFEQTALLGVSPQEDALKRNNGFDCVLGNPPWEQLQLDPREFFAPRDSKIAEAPNMAARDKMIVNLKNENYSLYTEFELAKHDIDACQKFIHSANRFPLTSFGRINLYSLFAELAKNILSFNGRASIIVPTGIATDSFNQYFFADLIKSQSLASLYDFENQNIFTAVHRSYKFSILSISRKPIKQANLAFFLTQPKQIENRERIFQISPQDIALMNPNTLTCPVFRTSKDAELTKKIYQRVPVLENEKTGVNPWGISFMIMFMMNTDSGLFKNEAGEGLLPLYEGKMVQAYDHRAASVVINTNNLKRPNQPCETKPEQYTDPNFSPKPQYWIKKVDILKQIDIKRDVKSLISFKRITSSTNERTFIATLLPLSGISDSLFIILTSKNSILNSCLLSNLNSLAFDFICKQKVGGVNLSFFIVKQLPIIPPDWYTPEDIEFISSRVLELVYTAYDMKPFAQDMGYDGEPFIWDENRRAILRAELDAKYAKLYGLTRDELRYILDPANIYGAEFPSETFRVLKNKEINKYGEYRTQRLVLAAWDMLGF
jgi:hypothetical protein